MKVILQSRRIPGHHRIEVMMVMENLISQAEHARRCGVSGKSVTIWKQSGQLVLVDGMVDFDASYKGERWFASTKKAHQDAEAAAKPGTASPRAAGNAARKPRPSTPVTLTRAEIVRRLLALDWIKPFDGSPGALKARINGAAAAVGLVVAESSFCDTAHWQGLQLRDRSLMKPNGGLSFEAVVAGYGFELDEWDILVECRERLHRDDLTTADLEDLIEIRLDLLPLLAYPFGEHHRPPINTTTMENT